MVGSSKLPTSHQSSPLDHALPAAVAAFPGSALHFNRDSTSSIVSRSDTGDADVGYCVEPYSEGDYILYRTTNGQLPFRLGRLLRTVDEYASSPYVVVESWWPIAKPDTHGNMLNLFGTWVASSVPIRVASGLAKRQRTDVVLGSSVVRDHQTIVDLCAILVWPIVLIKGSLSGEGGMIPFDALTYAQMHYGIDLRTSELAFSRRGQEFIAYCLEHGLS